MSDIARQLGIDDTLQKLSKLSKMSDGRPVNTMIFESPAEIKAKGKGIRIPGKCGVCYMKKSYFLKYGSNVSKEGIKSLRDIKWDTLCSESDSLYFGVYFIYSGLHADKLTIAENYISS